MNLFNLTPVARKYQVRMTASDPLRSLDICFATIYLTFNTLR